MKRPVEHEYTSHVAYTRALELYCDQLRDSYLDRINILMQDVAFLLDFCRNPIGEPYERRTTDHH